MRLSIASRGCFFLIVLLSMLGMPRMVVGQKAVNQDSLQATLTFTELLIKADELNNRSKNHIQQLSDTTELHSFKVAVNAQVQRLTDLKSETDFFLKAYSRDWLIRNLQVKWNREESSSQKLLESITRLIQQEENELRTKREMRATWTTTRNEIIKDNLSESLRKPISELLTNLWEEDRLLQRKIRNYLGQQQQVATARSEVSTYQEMLRPYLNQDFSLLLKRNETVIWKRDYSADSVQLISQLHRTYALSTSDAGDYLKGNAGKLVLTLLLGVFIAWIILSAKKTVTRESSEATDKALMTQPLKHTGIYTYTFIVILLLVMLNNPPPLLTELLLLLFTFPLIVLVIGKAKGAIRFITASFLVLYWSYKLFNFLIIDNRLTSYIDLFHSVAAAIIFVILFKRKQEFRSQFPELYELLKGSLIPVLLVLTCLAVVLQITGFSLLARALTNGAINYGYLAPVILISAVIAIDIFRILARTPVVKNSVLAQQYFHLIYSGIKLTTIYFLFIVLVRGYSLEPAFLGFLQQIWNFGGQFGQFTITLGSVLEFFIIIITAVLISGIIQVLLEGEILARMKLKRGVGMAIGVIARYSIVVLGFLMAVASTGFDLTKISILAGAIGVGIGFGLQNLVANFMAGLILIFERPFVVNDTIESEQIEGTVQEIGIRASKILTYDGAEVIIPNSNLISNRVSNWTLTSSSRRQIIIVRTAMRADPDGITKILIQIASRQENVLVTPEPFVVFEGQVEQSLQFKLYYWLVSEMLKTRSDINLQIYRELKTMGVELPIPVHTIQSKQDYQLDKDN
jgi:potassium-dependent mechanosensitive channel